MKEVVIARKENASIKGATNGPPVARSAASGSAPAARPASRSSPSPLLPSTAASQRRNISSGTAVPNTMACLRTWEQGQQGWAQLECARIAHARALPHAPPPQINRPPLHLIFLTSPSSEVAMVPTTL